MIRIKVIEVKKCFKLITILTTILMFALFFSVLMVEVKDTSVVKANGIETAVKMDRINQDQDIHDNIFVMMMNKAIPLMDVMYEETYGAKDYKGIMKLALSRLIHFDYQDPKTLLQAQIPIVREIDPSTAIQSVNGSGKITSDDVAEVPVEIPDVQPNTEVEDDQHSTTEVPMTPSDSQPTTADPMPGLEIVSSMIPAKMPNKLKLDTKKPTIFIFHTHATESYLPESGGNFHSLENRKYTVRYVGDRLEEQLVKKGYKIIHDDTVHDHPSYEQSYVRSLETLRKNLKEQPSLKIVFDVHRDAVMNQDQANNSLTINGEKVAKFQLILGGKNDNYDQLKTFADYFYAKSESMYPGLAKKSLMKDYAKFNQYNSDYYLLIEIGNISNHVDEAVRTTKYVAEIMDAVIQDIKE
ncbi:stage II sporulation protein P [Anaerosolibacter carboniphilus]|uniref:Stage II sporulation protein P n=1 Tax=Anaerosolibacter carboniphilus TaxID=1417629 RepID=A0A841KWD3_9FIRM|nr:stage II sporulation protein P [Anaerosolibacter carboniphilus]MBB6217944.1 stage II sporulation protein P [Anaerosolibacter carboniphilus]